MPSPEKNPSRVYHIICKIFNLAFETSKLLLLPYFQPYQCLFSHKHRTWTSWQLELLTIFLTQPRFHTFEALPLLLPLPEMLTMMSHEKAHKYTRSSACCNQTHLLSFLSDAYSSLKVLWKLPPLITLISGCTSLVVLRHPLYQTCVHLSWFFFVRLYLLAFAAQWTIPKFSGPQQQLFNLLKHLGTSWVLACLSWVLWAVCSKLWLGGAWLLTEVWA